MTENNSNNKSIKNEEKQRYNALEREQYWRRFWDKEKIYKFNPNEKKPLYTIDTPPPTISGFLHMGHVFSYTQAEIIARFKRMTGYNVRYPQGFDNNGLPTERLTEKEINRRGQDIGLKKFILSCLKITEKYKKIYENLWKLIGLSMNWELTYSTIDHKVQKLAQSVFKDLYNRKIIYRKKAPALYCPECYTSFAQAEKEDKEKEGIFVDLIFKTEDGKNLIISTTRPELLPACGGVFVHPNDKRYKELIGKKVETPLKKKVVVFSDEKVDMKKGSGAVMCCSYGDETDIYWVKTYNLEERIIINKEGKIENVNEIPEINGKTTEEAKYIIVKKLNEQGFVKKIEKIKHIVGVHERCGTPVEIILRDQWFVKILDKKDVLLKMGNKINWYPHYMKKRYEEWVLGLKWDWCISRERFFGIPIPVFHCDNCKKIIIPDEKKFPIDPKTEKIKGKCSYCKKGKLIPEKNVLDTWFTSALTPDINNDNPLNGKLNGKMYPMSMRPMAHDIIRTWAVYSILMGIYRHKKQPWKDLMISGHLLLKKGEKISKKTGGGKYKPEDLINTKSADAVRYAMFGGILGKDLYFDEMEIEKGRKLTTKIFNAGRFVLMKLKDFSPKEIKNKNIKLEEFDKWILQKSFKTVREMAKVLEKYQYFKARKIFEDFFWSEFCDNYLEIAKGRLSINSNDKKNLSKKISAQYATYYSFLNILKMAALFVPYITEEIYHSELKDKNSDNIILISEKNKGYFYKNEKIKSIHKTLWPLNNNIKIENSVIKKAKTALMIISQIRKIKSTHNIKLGENISVLKIKCPLDKQRDIKPFLDDIAYIAKAEKIEMEEGENIEISI